MGSLIDLTGQRFGRLTVIKRISSNNRKQAVWLCQCDCGRTTNLVSGQRGRRVSCGCAKTKATIERNTTHGHSKVHALYETWKGMFARCNNPNHSSYHRYGGRGIAVCARWVSFFAFAKDMGDRPEGSTLDRIDNDAGYSPGNCRWATREEQRANSSTPVLAVTVGGVTKTVAEWAAETGANPGTIRNRLRFGVPPEEAVRKGRLPRDNTRTRKTKMTPTMRCGVQLT